MRRASKTYSYEGRLFVPWYPRRYSSLRRAKVKVMGTERKFQPKPYIVSLNYLYIKRDGLEVDDSNDGIGMRYPVSVSANEKRGKNRFICKPDALIRVQRRLRELLAESISNMALVVPSLPMRTQATFQR